MKYKSFTIVSIIIYITLGISPAISSEWFVDNSASGNNSGTSWYNAWGSFSSINWENVLPGDSIYLSGGPVSKVYNETLRIGSSGDIQNRIKILPGSVHPNTNIGHQGMVIVGQGSDNGINFGSHDYVTIDGNDGEGNINIRITNTNNDGVVASDSIGIKLLYLHVYRCGNSSNDDGIQFSSCDGGSEIAYCDVEDPWQDGIKVSGHYRPTNYGKMLVHHNWIHGMVDDGISGDGGLDIYNNRIGPWGSWSSASGHPDGMQLYAGYLRIFNNTIYTDHWPNGSNGLIFLNHAFGSNHDMDHVKVFNNLFMTSGESCAGAHFFGLSIAAQGGEGNEDMNDIIIANNTFVDVGHVALSVSARDSGAKFTNFKIKNNIVYNCKLENSPGVITLNGFDFNNSDIDIDRNIIVGGSIGGDEISWNGISYSVSDFNEYFNRNNISEAPDFLIYSASGGLSNNLRLANSDNVARDAGISLPSELSFAIDKDGQERPQGDGWDIGAYEVSSANTPISTTPSVPMYLRIVDQNGN